MQLTIFLTHNYCRYASGQCNERTGSDLQTRSYNGQKWRFFTASYRRAVSLSHDGLDPDFRCSAWNYLPTTYSESAIFLLSMVWQQRTVLWGAWSLEQFANFSRRAHNTYYRKSLIVLTHN